MGYITLNSKNDPRAMDARSAIARRIGVGVVISVALNIAAFAVASRLIEPGSGPVPLHPEPVEVALRPELPVATPTPLPSKPIPTPKPTPTPVATPAPVATPTPTPHARATPLPTPKPQATPVPQSTPARLAKPAPRRTTVRPEGAHNKVVMARPTLAASSPQDFTVRSGGNARAGQVMAQQSAGNAQSAPDVPTAPVKPISTPDPTPTPAPVARVAEAPTPAPTPVPTPEAPRTRRAGGANREAEAVSQVNPAIPDNVKRNGFKGIVRVKVLVHADGTFEPILRTSTGDTNFDADVLNALKKWKWKPKLVDGVPQDSTVLFAYDVNFS